MVSLTARYHSICPNERLQCVGWNTRGRRGKLVHGVETETGQLRPGRDIEAHDKLAAADRAR
jgi:hypothetical protein